MKELERTLTSLEVAELMERPHKKLLETIRIYVSYMEQLEKEKSTSPEEGRLKYFIDSSYIAGNGQEQPCYKITKIGCEFLAHKMKGIKGTEFTMRYIDRFHEMEEAMNEPKSPKTTMELLELHYKALKEIDEKVDKADERISALDKKLQDELMNLPILGVEESKIEKATRRRGTEVLGGKQSNAYNDKSLRGKLYWDLHIQLRREFNVSTYKAIKRNQTDLALEFLAGYRPPLFLQEQIESANAQQTLDFEGGAESAV